MSDFHYGNSGWQIQLRNMPNFPQKANFFLYKKGMDARARGVSPWEEFPERLNNYMAEVAVLGSRSFKAKSR